MTEIQGQKAEVINRAFEEEYLRFLLDRSALRRFVPTPDSFPLICQLMHEAKRHYRSLPRARRFALRYITFSCFGREWAMRANFSVLPRDKAVYLDLCAAERRSVLVTLCVGFDNDLLEASDA